jgi:hypothetical protein
MNNSFYILVLLALSPAKNILQLIWHNTKLHIVGDNTKSCEMVIVKFMFLHLILQLLYFYQMNRIQVRNPRYIFILLTALCLIFNGCYKQHFLNHYNEIGISSKQMILEAVGDTVPFQIIIKVPAKMISGNIVLKFTPILTNDSIKTFYPAFTISSERPNDTNYNILPLKNETVTVDGYFMNFEQLRNSHFIIEWNAVYKGKTASLPDRLLGYGISQIYHYWVPEFYIKPGFDPAKSVDKIESTTFQDAETFYMHAILCARMFDENCVKENLSKSISIDGYLRQRLVKDVEFIGYRKTEWYQQIIKTDQ